MKTEEFEIDYPFKESVTLAGIESVMRMIENDIKISMALLAVSLGRIKRDGLFYDVASNFKEYIRLERTNLSYQKAIHLSEIGLKYWEFQTEFRQNKLKLSKCMSKIRLIDRNLVENDPMFWGRFKELSVRELKAYIERRNSDINVYTANSMTDKIRVSDASLFIGEEKIKGINLKDAREQTAAGRRAVVFWVDNDNQARKIRRRVENFI